MPELSVLHSRALQACRVQVCSFRRVAVRVSHRWHAVKPSVHGLLSVGSGRMPLIDVADQDAVRLGCCKQLLHVRRLPACHMLAHASNVLLIGVVRLLQQVAADRQRTRSALSTLHNPTWHASKEALSMSDAPLTD